MRLIAKKPCSYGGKKFFIGDEIPAELVVNIEREEKLGVISAANDEAGVPELPGLTSRPQWFRGTCGLQGVYSFRTGRHSECHCRRCYQEKLELLCQQTA